MRIRLLAAISVLTLASGCSMNAVHYQPDFDLVNEMKDRKSAEMGVGEIATPDPRVNKLSIRGSAMVSTHNQSYGDYLKVAIQEQLKQAGLYQDSSPIVITGELLGNKINAAGFSVGTAHISARFVVQKTAVTVFDKLVSIEHEWESSFLGAVAIPNAQNNYPIAVQKLITELMSDDDFVTAVGHQEQTP